MGVCFGLWPTMKFQFVPPKGNLLLDVCVAQPNELIIFGYMWLVWLTATAGEEAEHRKLITGSGHICGAAVDWGPRLPEQHPQGFSRQAQPKWCKDFFVCWQTSENMNCSIDALFCLAVLERHLNHRLCFLFVCTCRWAGWRACCFRLRWSWRRRIMLRWRVSWMRFTPCCHSKHAHLQVPSSFPSCWTYVR